AGTNYSVLFTVKQNDKVDIVQSSNGWYKIKTNSGKEGWASSSYISVNNASNGSSTSGITKTVNTNGLNIRSGAGTSYRVIGTLNKGSKVEVTSESNGWTKIKQDGRIGYVASKYLDSQSSSNSSNVTKEVTTNGLNVRSGPGTSYGVVGKLNQGNKVQVISESSGWSKINFNGKTAYASTGYLKNTSQTPNPTPPPNPNPPSTSNPDTKPEEIKETKEVNTNGLNVRSGPSTSYGKIGALSKGNKVGVMSEGNGWSKIDYNGKVGYVSSQYLTKVTTNPTPTPPPTTNPPTTNPPVTDGGGTVNNTQLNYTLDEHVNAQYDRISVGGNVIDSSKPRNTEALTTYAIRQARAFVPADKTDLEYFLNPSNFISSKKGMLQFLRIDSYKEGASVNELNSYLNSLAPATSGTNVFYNQGQTFINSAKKYNIDVVYLVSHAMWETAYGKSTLAQGQTLTTYKGEPLDAPVTVYNFFGIGAIDKSANVSGAEAAYSNGWTSVEATIDGSAGWIAQNYIKNSKYNQNTIYKMKFNYSYTWHQYATDVNWANGISGIMYKLVDMYDSQSSLVYDVPAYKK
ncbi:SH3 domain-containing protein, partial [Romboutsia sp.]|uniref:SH3 domain-containing protein n=1 Tax=Romboutsia sp. TaxID=1965302 RepID=UPI003F40E9A2